MLSGKILRGSCVCSHPSIDLFSYFSESDLELAGDRLGYLDEEGRLVGVVFNDVVVHVDEDPVGNARVKFYSRNTGRRSTSGKKCFSLSCDKSAGFLLWLSTTCQLHRGKF